jgi:hypothetical protein
MMKIEISEIYLPKISREEQYTSLMGSWEMLGNRQIGFMQFELINQVVIWVCASGIFLFLSPNFNLYHIVSLRLMPKERNSCDYGVYNMVNFLAVLRNVY